MGDTTDGSMRASGTLTAGEVVERIKKNVHVRWRSKTVDAIVCGDPGIPVRGISTAFMATLDVLTRSAAAGRNMVITHEPTFYLHQDALDPHEKDAVYRRKADFIRSHDMAVFHFHDHWHAHSPDGIAAGMVRELGWETHADAAHPNLFLFPGTPLARFASDIGSLLSARTIRVVGDPDLPVHRVLASWGFVSREPGMRLLARLDVDVLVAGEAHEWEVVEYVQDAIAAGKRKALILLGHASSEQAGMRYCAQWLGSFITEVPIEFVPNPEPFWSPWPAASRTCSPARPRRR